MAVNQMISVLDQYDKFLQVFSHPIIEWKTAQRKLVYYKSVKKSIFWCFNVLGGFGLHCLAGTFLLLLVLHGSTTLSPLPVLMVHVILLFLWCYNLSAGLALMIHGERFVDGWNLLFAKFRKVESKGSKRTQPPDLFWLAMSSMIYQFTFFPIILIAASSFLNLDPLLHLHSIAHFTPLPHFLIYLVLLYVVMATHFEGCRLYALPLMIDMLQVASAHVVLEYVKLFIILEKMRRLQELFVVLFILIGMGATVLFTFVTIRMYHHFPVWFYSYFPVVNVFVVVVAMIGLAVGVEVKTRSERVLRVWEVWMWVVCTGWERRIMKRRLKSMRAMEIGGMLFYGRLYYLERGIQVKYFEKVVIYTVNLLLGVPKF
ncbi:hypothetical protein Fcan01_24108 [Folsomia candida]|uniref:Uncharacterized protein n=1 Tax=Folsomia candida TaxID=158441 RepID=A0A226D6Y3_FOLCA|nr:hypothetical protein Fcan01_24108 [Folsomia candida]